MNSKALPRQINNLEVGVYECEIHLKFRLIEEKSLLGDSRATVAGTARCFDRRF
jgi:hypothetical protein